MFTLENSTLRFAKMFRGSCDLLVAGGPLPSSCPEDFLKYFDVVVIGEGEQTMLDLAKSLKEDIALSNIPGIAYQKPSANGHRDLNGDGDCDRDCETVRNPPRKLAPNLDSTPFPARGLFENEAYQKHSKRTRGYTVTSLISSRGCPFNCDFCSKPVFGNTYRERSAENVVDEIEDVLSLGYERIFFQDDCFTLNEKRVLNICEEILHRKISFDWECLSRVDAVNPEIVSKMKEAGCKRTFFGIEAGDNAVLKLMQKQFTVEQARTAVELTASEGVKAGAFFILGYPGETEETILETVRFATSLPLDYLSFTLPYPIPGTALYAKTKSSLKDADVLNGFTHHHSLIDHTLTFNSPISEGKLKFAIAKATIQFKAKKHLGSRLYPLCGGGFEALTDQVFKALK